MLSVFSDNFQSETSVIWRENYCEKSFKSSEIFNQSKTILNGIGNTQNQSRIAVKIEHSPALLPVILSIFKNKSCFCPIGGDVNAQKVLEMCKDFIANILISEDSFDQLEFQNSLKLLKTSIIFNREIYIYSVLNIEDMNFNGATFCYAIRTSGTTGEPKTINVPEDCISSNILELSRILQITREDVIFVSSPPTFDPFLVEILLALTNGAKLLMVAKNVRLSAQILSQKLFPGSRRDSVTFIQMTPSLFCRFKPETLKEKFFSEESTLRSLILGGESFPSLDVFQENWKLEKPKRIFNIYGITEVSCWSTICEITKNTSQVTLGQPIDGSIVIEIRNDKAEAIEEGIGQLFIGSSSRKCLLSDEESSIIFAKGKLLFRGTGDVVKIQNNRKYLFQGRKNDVVKRFGHRVSLVKIEETFRKIENISDACCVFNQAKNIFVAFIITNVTNVTKKLSKQDMRCNLQPYEQPDEFIEVKEFPLSCHGKISKRKLFQIYEEHIKTKNISSLPDLFLDKFNDYLNNITATSEVPKRAKFDLNCSFLSLGGNSFTAISLTNELEQISGLSLDEIFPKLLNNKCGISDILTDLHVLEESRVSYLHFGIENDLNNKFTLNTLWTFDLKKCVDANPTVVKIRERKIVAIGSHSHILANLDADTGEMISSVELPDRIEGQVTFLPDKYGIVGCYNGCLYKFNILTGEIVWTFDSGGMIKSKPLIFDDLIIFGNYGETKNLFCVDSESKICKWSSKIGQKGVLSSIIKFFDTTVLACTLDGTIASVNITTGEIVKTIQLKSPIFSTSAILNNHVVVAEVAGIIHCFTANFKEVWKFEAPGTIFSSPQIIETQETKNTPLIIFGCHDKSFYCLQYFHDLAKVKLLWKCDADALIYSTPKLFKFKDEQFLIGFSTKGKLYMIEIENGKILLTTEVEGDIFSSPAINGDKIYVGCRNNKIYCFKFIQQ